MPVVSYVSRSTSENVFPKLASFQSRVYTQAELDFTNGFLNPLTPKKKEVQTEEVVQIEKVPSPDEVIISFVGKSDTIESVEVVTSESPDILAGVEDLVTDEIIKNVIRNDVMIPDTARTFPELSDGISKSNYLPDFIYSGIEEYLDFSEFDTLLHSDNSSLDQDLYPNSFDDDDFCHGVLNDDDYVYNLHEEPYQEKPNPAAIEAAAFKSCQLLISPELCHIVNPNEVYPNHQVVKFKVTDDVMVNNSPRVGKDGKIYEYVYVKKEEEVHNDHSYFKEAGVDKSAVIKTEIKQEPMSDDEYDYQVPVAVKVEAPPAVKRPVGRPRKIPVAAKPIKRTSDHFTDETNEEFVDVESIEVKRPRKSRGKSIGGKRLTYPKQHKSLVSHFREMDPFNPNGYVMRQAKTSAIKKITKTTQKTAQGVSRSKRSDHNDMERRRRHEMRNLFDKLKRLVPTELLVDDNNKIKKNPSKNTILNGSHRYVEILYETKMEKNSLVQDNQKLLKKCRRLVKSLRKLNKKVVPRRYVC